MRVMTSAGPTAQPTRSPVAANAFEMPSTKSVYARHLRHGATRRFTCAVSPNVSIQ